MSNQFSARPHHKLLLALAFIGLGLSLFLAYQYAQPAPVVCIGGDIHNTCEIVRSSKYSSLFGVKLPFWGALYFMGISFYLLLPLLRGQLFTKSIQHIYTTLLGFVLFFAAVFETYMTYLQIFKINAVCSWCTLVELVVFSMFVVFVSSKVGQRRLE